MNVQQDATPCNIGRDRLNEIPSSLNEKQALAIEMLAAGKSLAQVIEALAIDRSTLWRWRKDESFKEALQERMREVWLTASARLRAMLEPALDVMAEQLAARYDLSRVRAATTILRLSGLSKVARPET